MSDPPTDQPHIRPRRGRRLVVLVAVALLLVFAGITARLFVWPEQGVPDHVDAIVELDGPGTRDTAAQDLARAHRAPVLVVSTVPEDAAATTRCPPGIPDVTIICFIPDPRTTQGEAEYVGRLAAQHGWRSIALVTTPDQAWRARLRLQRCFDGAVYLHTAPLPAMDLLEQIPYQWAATTKALILDPDC